jgi:hypothetical protein
MAAIFCSANGATTWSNFGAVLNRQSGRGSNWHSHSGQTYLPSGSNPTRVWKDGILLSSSFNLAPINAWMIPTVEGDGTANERVDIMIPVNRHETNDVPTGVISEIYFPVPTNAFVKTMMAVFRSANGASTWSNCGAVLNRQSGRGPSWRLHSGQTYLQSGSNPTLVWIDGTLLSSSSNLIPIKAWMILTVEVTQSLMHSPTKSQPTIAPTTQSSTTQSPTQSLMQSLTESPPTTAPTTQSPTTQSPTQSLRHSPTESPPTTAPTTTTQSPTQALKQSPTESPPTIAPTTQSPTTQSPTQALMQSPTKPPPTIAPTTQSPTTQSPT